MKSIFTHLLGLIFVFSFTNLQAQVLNQSAAWPNASWVVSGTYTGAGLINNPTTSTSFLFDDDAAGNGSVDMISAESPTIDLTAANTAGEIWLNVASSFVYREIYGALTLQYWDADGSSWVNWEGLSPNSTNYDFTACANQVAYSSSVLDIGAFTATQLSGFKYRFNYDDAADWNWGFCIASPIISSIAPPSCLDPTNLGVANVTTNSADLFWTGSGTVISYNLAIDTAGFIPTGSATVVTGSGTSVSGLMSGTAYDFYIQSVCGGDSSNYAGPFTFTTLADYCGGDKFYDTGGANGTYSSNENTVTTICPDNPGDVILATFTAIDIETNWDALYVFDGATTASPLIASPNGPTQSNFPAGGYYGTVNPGPFVSTDASGCLTFQFLSDGSVTQDGWEVSIVCTDSVVCEDPINLAAANITETSADLTWTGSGTAVSYYVLVDTAGFTPTGSGTAVASNAFLASGLTPGTAYDYYVMSDCNFGLSNWVGPFTFTTLAPCPVNVVLPGDSTICTNQSIALDAGAGPYTYLWSTGETTQTILVDSASLGGAGVYTISVTVTDTANNCSEMDDIVVTMSTCTGINDVFSNIDILLYPNPSNGLFNIDVELEEKNDVTFQILDINGKVIYKSNAYKNVSTISEFIDISNEAKGVYFLQIYSGLDQVTKRILVE